MFVAWYLRRDPSAVAANITKLSQAFHGRHNGPLGSRSGPRFNLGILVKEGETSKIFTNPENSRTQDYITGRFD
jgi:hypothetical protein